MRYFMRMVKSFYILLLFLIYSNSITAKSPKDSLFQVYQKSSGNKKIDATIAYACHLAPPDTAKALSLFRDAVLQAQISHYTLGEIKAYHLWGWYYIEFLHEKNKALELYYKALELAIQEEENDEIHSIYLHIVDVHIFVSEIMEALNILHESRKFAEKVNPDKYLPVIDKQLMECYSNIGNYSKAYSAFSEGIVIAEKTHNLHALWILYSTMAEIKKFEKKLQESLYYLEKAIDIGLKNKESYAVLNQQCKVDLLIQLNRLDEAEKLCRSIEKVIATIPAFDFVGSTNSSLGLIYLGRKDYKKALIYTLASYKQIVPTGNITNILELDSTLSNIYFQLGDYRKSVESLSHYNKLKEQLYSKEKIREIQNLQHQFESEKKQLQLERIEFSKKFYLILSLTLLFILGLGIIIFYTKQKNNHLQLKLLDETAKNEEQKREKMQFEIDHNIRELTSMAIIADQKNVLWQNIKHKLQEKLNEIPTISENDSKTILKIIAQNTENQHEWDTFKIHFAKVHPNFFTMLSNIAPNLTQLELRQCAYIKINLSSKQVGNLLNISPDSVKKSRMRIKKKLNLSAEDSLSKFISLLHDV